MLIKFKVSNFLSFCEEQQFSLISGISKKKEEHIIDKNDLKLLKFSAIYGANASGKSNLLKAVEFSKSIIIKGIFSNVNNLYCRINKSNSSKISSFEFEIKLKDKLFAYGFDILLSENSIKAEWLYEIDQKKDKDVLIFTRKLNEDININEQYFDNNDIVTRLNVYYSDMKTQDNVLFLTIMNKNKDTLYKDYLTNNITIFRDLFMWFVNSLVIITPQALLDNSPYFLSEENIEKINEIIATFGTGIKKCKYEEISSEELIGKIQPPDLLKNIINNLEMTYLNNVKNGNETKEVQGVLRINKEMYILKKNSQPGIRVNRVVLEHKNNDGAYSFEEESDGTQRLFDLIEILLDRKNEKVYFIDEIDRCLHPQLTYKIIETFLNKYKNNNTQLIVTTHESRLLNFDLLRRDEIWFANRNKYGPTELYSLEEYNERFDKKIDKAYLEGRYGGVPIFETIFPIGDEEA